MNVARRVAAVVAVCTLGLITVPAGATSAGTVTVAVKPAAAEPAAASSTPTAAKAMPKTLTVNGRVVGAHPGATFTVEIAGAGGWYQRIYLNGGNAIEPVPFRFQIPTWVARRWVAVYITQYDVGLGDRARVAVAYVGLNRPTATRLRRSPDGYASMQFTRNLTWPTIVVDRVPVLGGPLFDRVMRAYLATPPTGATVLDRTHTRLGIIKIPGERQP